MFLNISEKKQKSYIYRIVKHDHLLDMFTKNQNVLVKPKLWEDGFENLILQSELKPENGPTIKYDVHERIYGQCWTSSKSCDAMWRIYSPDKMGIRIRTKVEDLLDSLNLSTGETPAAFTAIGRVKYLKTNDIYNLAKQMFVLDGRLTFGDLFQSLLVKRKAFKHENEIRLLFLDGKNTNQGDNLFRFKINPHKLISQIMLDPRLTYEEFKVYETKIRKATSYSGTIKRSLLYQLPKHIVVNINELKT